MKKCFALVKSLVVISVFSCSVTLYAEEPIWDGGHYADYSTMQLDMAQSALKHIMFKEGSRILDIGCGDGKITKMIADQVKGSVVVGIDHSDS